MYVLRVSGRPLTDGGTAVVGNPRRLAVSESRGRERPRSRAGRAGTASRPSVRGTVVAGLGAIASLGCAAAIGLATTQGSTAPIAPGTDQRPPTVQPSPPLHP
jgi:hypothetical protein